MSECIWIVCRPEQRAILFFCVTYIGAVLGLQLTNWVWSDEKGTNASPWPDNWWLIALVTVILYMSGTFNSTFLFF